MSIQKQGLVLHCENCRHVSSDGCGFDISVPVRNGDAAGTARLHCTISPDCHRVEFVCWEEEPNPPEAARRIREQVSDVISFIAEQRICGNERICPIQVVQLVEQHAAAATRDTRFPRNA